ncbi:hypothetical protein HMPREF1531_01779 [Propionibacterium sp. oral taxon 192 str. F0372]|uniref:SDR family NAD(P)-dependent oxidoreductase n=1 Tax=Propionibacterium sp. oral taxon 192 TaxID=671222 RepID=UPI0003541AE2|nr:SDR family NAD(P)-dependent oxidoreductase [Propionibacterium sp. oral taxon 192]EPH02473.1 hypothetical protein HMPREF1531_01779 [Propionibacterium sp. oral taxon 192 str. F0372]
MTIKKVLVTGGNRGIGREACRQFSEQGFQVYLGCRDLELGNEAAREIQSNGEVVPVRLDVRNPDDISSVGSAVGLQLDVLVNNAGTYEMSPFESLSAEALQESIDVHLMGAFRLTSLFLPRMNAVGRGAIVNVSSGGGAFENDIPGPAAYGIAKASMNALTIVASKYAVASVEVNAVCPGWVRTDMGGASAPRSVAEGVDTIVWLATRRNKTRINGRFLRDRKVIAW